MGMLPIVEYTDKDEGGWLAGVWFAASPLDGVTCNPNFELGLYRNLYPYIYFQNQVIVFLIQRITEFINISQMSFVDKICEVIHHNPNFSRSLGLETTSATMRDF